MKKRYIFKKNTTDNVVDNIFVRNSKLIIKIGSFILIFLILITLWFLYLKNNQKTPLSSDNLYALYEVVTIQVDKNILDKKDIEALNFFENKIKNKIPDSLLKKYYNNVNTLKWYTDKNNNRKKEVSSYYDMTKNRIINIDDDIHSKIHELFHVASTDVEKERSGFFIATDNVGKGITEGYTEYLTFKYFSDNIDAVFTYHNEFIICDVLNNIIGEEKMIEYYFNNRLESLIEDLASINNDDNMAIDFIKTVDTYNGMKMETKEDVEKQQQLLKKISYYLLTYLSSENLDEKTMFKIYSIYYEKEYDNFNKNYQIKTINN